MPLIIAIKYNFTNISRSTLGFTTKLGKIVDNFMKNNLKPIRNICGIQLNVINMLPYRKPPVPGILTSQPPSP